MCRKEKELESKVRKPAEAEKYRLEKIGRRTSILSLYSRKCSKMIKRKLSCDTVFIIIINTIFTTIGIILI
jgi:hypothetical protein